jgi:AraC family transcriptional regulator, regulatory protein of adaptative response / DNA-3-methyladenine glycosylase II
VSRLPGAVAADGPFDFDAMLAYFAPRAIRGVEHVADGAYRRVVPRGTVVAVERGPAGTVVASPAAADDARVRRLLGLDVEHAAAVAALRRDPLVGRRVRTRPGLRVPGTWDPYETGVRAIVGQQVSVAGASTITSRIVARHGRPIRRPDDRLTHAFPRADMLADGDLDGLGLTGARITAIRGWAAAVATGSIRFDRGAPLEDFVAGVVAIRGHGPWTAHYVALRAGYADAFPVGDLGLQRSAGLDLKALALAAERWRPFRALAAVHLWETPP